MTKKDDLYEAPEPVAEVSPEPVPASNTDALNQRRHDAHEAQDNSVAQYATDSTGAFIK